MSGSLRERRHTATEFLLRLNRSSISATPAHFMRGSETLEGLSIKAESKEGSLLWIATTNEGDLQVLSKVDTYFGQYKVIVLDSEFMISMEGPEEWLDPRQKVMLIRSIVVNALNQVRKALKPDVSADDEDAVKERAILVPWLVELENVTKIEFEDRDDGRVVATLD
jgi:hypothetical protein